MKHLVHINATSFDADALLVERDYQLERDRGKLLLSEQHGVYALYIDEDAIVCPAAELDSDLLHEEHNSGEGYGYGDGFGSWEGDGYGDGDGNGNGNGDGFGDGDGFGARYGDGDGSGDSDGHGNGGGDGYGDGNTTHKRDFGNVIKP